MHKMFYGYILEVSRFDLSKKEIDRLEACVYLVDHMTTLRDAEKKIWYP